MAVSADLDKRSLELIQSAEVAIPPAEQSITYPQVHILCHAAKTLLAGRESNTRQQIIIEQYFLAVQCPLPSTIIKTNNVFHYPGKTGRQPPGIVSDLFNLTSLCKRVGVCIQRTPAVPYFWSGHVKPHSLLFQSSAGAECHP